MEQPSHWTLWMARSLLQRPPTNSGLLGLFVLQKDFVFSPASLYAHAMALCVKVRGQRVERDFLLHHVDSRYWTQASKSLYPRSRSRISSTDIWCQDLKIKAYTEVRTLPSQPLLSLQEQRDYSFNSRIQGPQACMPKCSKGAISPAILLKHFFYILQVKPLSNTYINKWRTQSTYLSGRGRE